MAAPRAGPGEGPGAGPCPGEGPGAGPCPGEGPGAGPCPGAGPGEGPGPGAGPGPAWRRDPRVQCCSRQELRAVMELCAPFVRAALRGEPGGAAAEEEALGKFETALRKNVTIQGHGWEEVSDELEPQSDSSLKILEDQLDELIVETAKRRKQWPKKILVHAIQTMKAEQEMLKVYKPVVTPAEIRPQPSQDAYIADLKQVAEMVSKQISGAMKSVPALIERAEGFSQALTWQPTLELCKLRQEVFAGCKAKEEDDVENTVPPEEVTSTDTDTSKNRGVLLKRRKAVDSPERKRYPLRQRKIAVSA